MDALIITLSQSDLSRDPLALLPSDLSLPLRDEKSGLSLSAGGWLSLLLPLERFLFFLSFRRRLFTYFSQFLWFNELKSSKLAISFKYFPSFNSSLSLERLTCAWRNARIRSPFEGFIRKFRRMSSNIMVLAAEYWGNFPQITPRGLTWTKNSFIITNYNKDLQNYIYLGITTWKVRCWDVTPFLSH